VEEVDMEVEGGGGGGGGGGGVQSPPPHAPPLVVEPSSGGAGEVAQLVEAQRSPLDILPTRGTPSCLTKRRFKQSSKS
jgi:hypothetical protein